jgi:hypothetical protein
MPINIEERINTPLVRCIDCGELMDLGNDALPGYNYGCKLLCESAFNIIPNETIDNRAVFPDCPKLAGTVNEGNRYKVFKAIGENRK